MTISCRVMSVSYDLSRRLLQAIKRSGLTRAELSRRADLPYSVVHTFVAGKRTLTLESASSLCRVLKLELVAK